MKKNILGVVAIVMASMMLFSSCEKNSLVRIHAYLQDYTNDGNAKVHIDNTKTPIWDINDEININGTTYTLSNGANSNEVTLDGVAESAEGYKAIYPASIINGTLSASSTSVGISVPAYQTLEMDGGNQKLAFPMAASSSNTSLNFSNLCSLVKVTISNTTGENIKLRCITLKNANSAALTGTANVNFGATCALSGIAGNNYAYLDCNKYQLSNGATQSFYIVTFPFSGKLTAEVNIEKSNAAMYRYKKTSTSAVTISANQIGTIPNVLSGSENLINGYTIDGNTFIFTNSFSQKNTQSRESYNSSYAIVPSTKGAERYPTKNEWSLFADNSNPLSLSVTYNSVPGMVITPTNWENPVGITLVDYYEINSEQDKNMLLNAGATILIGYIPVSSAYQCRYWAANEGSTQWQFYHRVPGGDYHTTYRGITTSIAGTTFATYVKTL